MKFGQLYLSNGFIGVVDKLPRALKPDEWAGQPGTHVPHFWVDKAGETVSALWMWWVDIHGRSSESWRNGGIL
jgi:hypothetical protein